MNVWGVEHKLGLRETAQDGDPCELWLLYTWHPDAHGPADHTLTYTHLPHTHSWAQKEGRKANFSAHSTFVPNLPDVFFPSLPTAQEIYLLLDPVSLKSSNSLKSSPATTT